MFSKKQFIAIVVGSIIMACYILFSGKNTYAVKVGMFIGMGIGYIIIFIVEWNRKNLKKRKNKKN